MAAAAGRGVSRFAGGIGLLGILGWRLFGLRPVARAGIGYDVVVSVDSPARISAGVRAH